MDYKSILIILQIVTIVVGVVSWLNIKFNDFKHVAKRQDEMTAKLESVEQAVNENTKAVVEINARCAERHK